MLNPNPNPNRGQVKGWQRSENLGGDRPIFGKRGLEQVLRSRSFFVCGNPQDLSETLQRPIFTKFGHET